MKIKGTAAIIVLLLFSIFSFTGCASLKEKFIPKPKEEKVHGKRYYQVKEYDVHPSIELYTKRYIFWKNWHDEILSLLDRGNHKKQVTAIEQDISNLNSMQSMLVDEKAAELGKIMDKMIEIESVIKDEGMTMGNKIRVRQDLEALGREIHNNFSYNKMRTFIRSDFKNE